LDDNYVVMDFINSPKRLLLTIDGPLDADYGGRINQISKNANNIIIETERGCVKL